jgi:hypothetical protein
MSWATVMPAIIGGMVGLAGIGATLASTRITVRSGAARARREEKLRIYAAFLGAIADTVHAT